MPAVLYLSTQGSNQAPEGPAIASGRALLGCLCHMHVHPLAMQQCLWFHSAVASPSCKSCICKAPLPDSVSKFCCTSHTFAESMHKLRKTEKCMLPPETCYALDHAQLQVAAGHNSDNSSLNTDQLSVLSACHITYIQPSGLPALFSQAAKIIIRDTSQQRLKRLV